MCLEKTATARRGPYNKSSSLSCLAWFISHIYIRCWTEKTNTPLPTSIDTDRANYVANRGALPPTRLALRRLVAASRQPAALGASSPLQLVDAALVKQVAPRAGDALRARITLAIHGSIRRTPSPHAAGATRSLQLREGRGQVPTRRGCLRGGRGARGGRRRPRRGRRVG